MKLPKLSLNFNLFSIKNKIILLVFLAVLALVAFGGSIVYLQQEKFTMLESEMYAKKVSGEIMNSLVNLMKGKSYNQSTEILNAFLLKPEISSVRVYRSPLLEVQYGPTPAGRGAVNSFEQSVFASDKPRIVILGSGDQKAISMVTPMVADESCLTCHKFSRGDVLGGIRVTMPLSYFGKEVKADRAELKRTTMGFLVVLSVLIYSVLSRLIDKPINKVVEAAEIIADGRISGVKLGTPGRDEIGKLTIAFTKMVDSLTAIADGSRIIASGDLTHGIAKQGELASGFNNMTNSLSRLVEKIRGNSHALNAEVEKINSVARDQVKSAEDQVEEIDRVELVLIELSASATEAANSSSRVSDTADASVVNASEGRNASAEGRHVMRQITALMAETAKQAQELKSKTAQIGNVLGLINDIALETKILSVNASIEASKAGESGKGFSVVAEEFAKHAENVVQATAAIKEINDEIQGFSEQLAGKVEESGKAVKHGEETMRNVDGRLEEILKAAQKTAEATRTITNVARTQSDRNRAILATMQAVSGKSKELVKLAQGTLSETDHMRVLFEGLDREVSRFKINGGEEDA